MRIVASILTGSLLFSPLVIAWLAGEARVAFGGLPWMGAQPPSAQWLAAGIAALSVLWLLGAITIRLAVWRAWSGLERLPLLGPIIRHIR